MWIMDHGRLVVRLFLRKVLFTLRVMTSGAFRMKVEFRSVVYDASRQDQSGQIAFFDSLVVLASGTWLSGFTTGQTKHHPECTIRLSRSRDGGQSWSVLPCQFESRWGDIPGSLAGAEMVEVQPGRLLLFSTWFDRTDPDRPLFDPETEGILRSRQLMAVSSDEGDSWSDWCEIPTPGLTGCALTGPVVKWSDGSIALAFESFKEFDDPAPAHHAAWLLVSRDGGETFEPPFLVAQDPKNEVYYWDQRLCAGSTPGAFTALFWTHDRTAQRDLSVHLLSGSLNNGDGVQTSPVATTIPGQIAAPLLFDDGRLLAFVVDRDRPGTMRLWQSSDGGQSWPECDSLVVHEHEERAELSQGLTGIDFAEYWEDMGRWSFGHPAIRRAGPQHLLVTWYAGTPTCMSVHAAGIDVTPFLSSE